MDRIYGTGELTITPTPAGEALDITLTDIQCEINGYEVFDCLSEGNEDSVGFVPDGNGGMTIGVIPGTSRTTIWFVEHPSGMDYPDAGGALADVIIELIDRMSAFGSEVTGTLLVRRESDGAVWRYRVEGGNVHTERAKLIWPDGEEDELGGEL